MKCIWYTKKKTTLHGWATTNEQIRTLTTAADNLFPKEEKESFPEVQTLSKISDPKHPKIFSYGSTKMKHGVHLWDGPNQENI